MATKTKGTKNETVQISGADMVVRALLDAGVEIVFGYPGGAVLPIYDSIFKQNRLRHILCRHEQAAVHAAEGYSRSTGKIGAVLVTSGPGATNAVTGLTDALMDSIPIICITGQVPTHLIGNDAFQECDTTGITRPCTKHNYLVRDVEKLAKTLHEAKYIAVSGRPGPVLVDIPKDVLFAVGSYSPPNGKGRHPTYRPATKPQNADIEAAVELILKAKRPIIYAGGGVINSGAGASSELRKFAAMTGFPCTLTLMGLGAFPASDPAYLGMLGMHGTYEANLAMFESDLILAFGSRFDDRITGRLDGFAPKSKKVHVDIDASSINKNVMVDVSVVGDVGKVLTALNIALKKRNYKKPNLDPWWKKIAGWRKVDSLAYKPHKTKIRPQHAIARLGEITAHLNPYFTTDVGQHQMWAAQLIPFDKPKHWMTSGGLGTMGYGVPAAIGTQLAHPKDLVIAVTSEGSVQMNIQELSTAMQFRLPIKIVIVNNRYLGMVRQWQELLHGSRFSESYCDAVPDFVKLAESYGGVGLRVDNPKDLDATYEKMIAINNFVIVDVVVTDNENCYPMIPSGAGHNEILLGNENKTKQKSRKAVSEKGMVLV